MCELVYACEYGRCICVNWYMRAGMGGVYVSIVCMGVVYTRMSAWEWGAVCLRESGWDTGSQGWATGTCVHAE